MLFFFHFFEDSSKIGYSAKQEKGSTDESYLRTIGNEHEQVTGMKAIKSIEMCLLNGAAWRTEKQYVDRYKGTYDIIFGIEHRMGKDDMKGKFNKEAKQGWRPAADAARITDEGAGLQAHVRWSLCGD